MKGSVLRHRRRWKSSWDKYMRRIVFVGASGHGKVCAEIAELSGEYNEIIFLDDNPLERKCNRYDVVGSTNSFFQYINDKTDFFVSIGKAETRKDIQEKIVKAGGKIATLVHPKSVISFDVQMGEGTVIMAGAVINANTQIGKGCIINTSSSVDHDCVVGSYCHVAVGAHLCGDVKTVDNVWVGAGAMIIQGVRVTNACVIGAGATVIKDIDCEGTYIGVPARKKTI